MNQTSTPNTQIGITIIRSLPIPQGGVTDAEVVDATTITGKIPAGIGAEEFRKTVLDALPQFEETNRTNTPDTQICIAIFQNLPLPQGGVTGAMVMGATTITGKIPASIGAEEVRDIILDALQQSYGKDFEETEGLALSVS